MPLVGQPTLRVIGPGRAGGSVALALSRAGWDVPAFVLEAATMHAIPDCGHLVTIEQPIVFGELVRRLTR